MNSLEILVRTMGCAGVAISDYHLNKKDFEESIVETFITLDSLYYELGMTDEPKIFYGSSEEKLLAAMIENLSDAYRAYFNNSQDEMSIYVSSARNNVFSYLKIYMGMNLEIIFSKYLLNNVDSLIEALKEMES